MKKLLFLTAFVSILNTCIGQQVPQQDELVKNSEYFLKKSKLQKNRGWALLGTGAGVSLLGIALYPKDYFIFGSESDERKANTAGIVLCVGAAISISSIPFFISASKNKWKSKNISIGLKLENRQLLQQYNLSKKGFPALSFKVLL